MDDQSIVDLYWKRSEQAISETDKQYGSYCFSIARNILTIREDAEEAVSDTYWKAWETMPPQRPKVLATYLGKITRNLAINKWRETHAAKRGGGEIALALEELEGCIAHPVSVERDLLRRELRRALGKFLDTLPRQERDVFLRRYFFLDPVAEIAEDFGFSQSKVKSMLHRTRLKLRILLEKEDLI